MPESLNTNVHIMAKREYRLCGGWPVYSLPILSVAPLPDNVQLGIASMLEGAMQMKQFLFSQKIRSRK